MRELTCPAWVVMCAQDRQKFSSVLDKIGVDQPEWCELSSVTAQVESAAHADTAELPEVWPWALWRLGALLLNPPAPPQQRRRLVRRLAAAGWFALPNAAAPPETARWARRSSLRTASATRASSVRRTC